ncbi:SAM-dependent methyltransferase [Mycobacterium alsense]|uniref:SAM-dependent methyltransferase n=1 Tax=Mycobacterium alsense TaxID=324058 RepID=A0AA41XTT7_9MYCO|nr:class I SAM-dependent methyltransferase [Mycobacterium alsense]MCV7380970.1 class I SAM-dependent methyltransferase [Mycobacterium alsense]OQZ91377.1 SAM-dependent methyltransferase [Mycobacterium alsense]
MDPAADRVVDLYQRHAVAWSRDRGDHLLERDWLERLLGIAPSDPAVLDMGCGSGVPMARHLIEHGCRVTGVDASSAMIAMCAGRFPGHEWRVADMRTLRLGRAFDAIMAWDSFFHLTQADQRRMFPIFARHGAAGAALMFTSGPAAGERVGSYRGEPLYHASLDADEYRRLLRANGFEVVAHVVEDPACGGRTVWLARRGGA